MRFSYRPLQGCAYAVSVDYDNTVAGDQQTAEVCDTTKCSYISLSELANVDRSGYLFDAYIAGKIGMCLSLFGLQDLLASFGFTVSLAKGRPVVQPASKGCDHSSEYVASVAHCNGTVAVMIEDQPPSAPVLTPPLCTRAPCARRWGVSGGRCRARCP